MSEISPFSKARSVTVEKSLPGSGLFARETSKSDVRWLCKRGCALGEAIRNSALSVAMAVKSVTIVDPCSRSDPDRTCEWVRDPSADPTPN